MVGSISYCLTMKLLFIRHAQSLGNQEGRMEGQGGLGLSPWGKTQAEGLAQKLLAEEWYPSQVYSSPAQRARETTEILLAALPASPRIPVTYAHGLQEFQNGIFQGLTWREAQQQYPDLCMSLENTGHWLPIPGAESLQTSRDRAHQFIEGLLTDHRDGDRLWIITHSWILQQLVAVLLGCDRTWGFGVGHTARFEFWLDRDEWFSLDQNRWNTELWQVKHFNDQQHLQRN